MADDLPEYKSFLLRQPCACQPCTAKPVVHHSTVGETFAPGQKPPKAIGGKRGQRQKASDWYGIPLCPHHHGEFHGNKGHFSGWTNESLGAWQRSLCCTYQETYLAERPPAQDVTLPKSRMRSKRDRALLVLADTWCTSRVRLSPRPRAPAAEFVQHALDLAKADERAACGEELRKFVMGGKVEEHTE